MVLGKVGPFVGAVVFAMSIAAPALADESSPSKEGAKGRQGRPAFEACVGLEAGDACRFIPPNRPEREGVCRQRGKGVLCVPDPVRRPPGKAPAITACEGLEEGSACFFELPGGLERAGTCRGKKDVLRCAPDRTSQPKQRERKNEPPKGE